MVAFSSAHKPVCKQTGVKLRKWALEIEKKKKEWPTAARETSDRMHRTPFNEVTFHYTLDKTIYGFRGKNKL